jgi:hypothetical protein
MPLRLDLAYERDAAAFEMQAERIALGMCPWLPEKRRAHYVRHYDELARRLYADVDHMRAVGMAPP